MTKKKSYNPFKMEGSYWGGFVFGLFGLKIMLIASNPSNYPGTTPFDYLDVILIIIHVIIGFFIGWGIHSLIRRLKK